ncbi:MAG: aminopeptidase P family protein [Ruminococcaceae bacterium]|nr:aminopeptidase P family protein [Oscillospiraceae bacterium]
MKILNKMIKSIPDGVDAYLLTDSVSQQYVSEFEQSDGYVLITRNSAYLFSDSRYIEAAKAEAAEGIEVVLLNGSHVELIKKYLESEKVKVLGFEDKKVSFAEYQDMLKNYSSYELVPVSGIIDKLREIKEDHEIEKIIAAQRMAEDALAHVLNIINPEMTEIDVALELECRMRKNGAESVSFQTIAVSGPASSLPHGVPSPVKLRKGFLTMDFGAKYKGYCSDMTRTVVIGKADDEMKFIYNTVLSAQKAAESIVAPGVKCRDVDKAARELIKSAGYGDNFGHGLGHGVGMYIHETPNFSPRASENIILLPGHVMTNEPGIYLEGKYGVRIEDMLVIKENGYENITLAPKELIELC